MPGVVSGTLLTFIPAAGDYVNADLLGSTDTRMVGNVIQTQFLRILDYPTAAALSFILMAAILDHGHRLHPPVRNGGPGLMRLRTLAARAISSSSRVCSPSAICSCPTSSCTVFSFNKPKGRFNYEWQQFSTDAWTHPCGVADMCGSLSLSLQIAAVGDHRRHRPRHDDRLRAGPLPLPRPAAPSTR